MPRPTTTPPPIPTNAPRAGRAFTIAEVIVTMVILGVIALAVVPRVSGSPGRREREALERAAAVIGDALRRRALLGEAAAIQLDEESAELRSLVPSAERPRRDVPAGWRPDPLTPAADLSGLEFVGAAVNGVRSPGRGLFIDLTGWDRTPGLVVYFDSESGDRRWRLSAAPGSWSASASSAAPGSHDWQAADRSIDLDRTRRGADPW